MLDFPFSIDIKALGVLLGLILVGLLCKIMLPQFASPYLYFSNLSSLRLNRPPTGKELFLKLPSMLFLGALLLFALAFINPSYIIPKKEEAAQAIHELPKEGIGIYLILDNSGSMAEKTASMDEGGIRRAVSKIDLLKTVTRQFIKERSSDLIGLIAFARVPKVLSPLTLNKNNLLHQLDSLKVVKSQEEDGTAMGYAIFKTAHLIAATRHFAQEVNKNEKAAYDMKSAIMIVVTDGLQDPNNLDKGNRLRTLELEEAATYAKSQNIKLYIINVDTRFAGMENFAPHRRLMEKITQMTGGQFFLVNDHEDLSKIYGTIDKLEKGTLYGMQPEKQSVQHKYLYQFFIALGLILFLSAIALESTYLRQAP